MCIFLGSVKLPTRSSKIDEIKTLLSHYNRNKIEIME